LFEGHHDFQNLDTSGYNPQNDTSIKLGYLYQNKLYSREQNDKKFVQNPNFLEWQCFTGVFVGGTVHGPLKNY